MLKSSLLNHDINPFSFIFSVTGTGWQKFGNTPIGGLNGGRGAIACCAILASVKVAVGEGMKWVRWSFTGEYSVDLYRTVFG